MRLEIICTGDEILTGKTINTNFSNISQKLEEYGLSVRYGTTVGDDPDSLLEAFQEAARRADIVIVNGGLGPTVDDLSQEIAAKAAGVALVMNDAWLSQIEAIFRHYGAVMQPNNRKQALLPATASLIDNPIGTACGFELDIGQAHFYFTPGVPKELQLMLDEQIIPRLLASAGTPGVVRVKRFHLFGLGESHADSLLQGLEDFDSASGVKIGFQTQYPQVEAKLALRGADPIELARRLAPIEAELHRRLGNFIVAEDDDTIEGVILAALRQRQASLAVIETFTSGLITARLAQLPDAKAAFRGGLVAPAAAMEAILGLSEGSLATSPLTEAVVTAAARAAMLHSGVTHALVTLLDPAENTDPNSGPALWFAVCIAGRVAIRHSRLRLIRADMFVAGAAEMGLDTLRRFLQDLPVSEKIDFEV